MSRPVAAQGRWALAVAAILWLPLLAIDFGYPSLTQVLDSPVLLRAALVPLAVAAGLTALMAGGVVLLSRRAARRLGLEPPVEVAVVLASGALLGLVVILGGRGASAVSQRLLVLAGELVLAAALGTLLALLVAVVDRRSPGAWVRPVAMALAAGGWAVLCGLLMSRTEAKGLTAVVWPMAAAAWLVGAAPPRWRRPALWSAVILSVGAAVFLGRLAPQRPAAVPLTNLRGETDRARPHVLVVMIDTWRWDATSLAEPGLGTTPHLARMAANGATVFARATAPAPSTLATVKGMITGIPASHFGVSGWGWLPPPQGAWTLARAFHGAGYRSAAFTANSLIRGAGFESGFERYWAAGGFDKVRHSFFLAALLSGGDYWRKVLLANALGVHKVDGDTLVDAFGRWLDEEGGERPVFAYLHLIEPHFPYRSHGRGLVPESLRDLPRPLSHVALGRLPKGDPRNGALRDTPELREMQGRYREEVREADRLLGRIHETLARRGLLEDTLTVVVGDHGEEFFEHDGFGHGHDVWQELVHVPMVVGWPAGERGSAPSTVHDPVSLLDLLPTLTDLLDLPAPAAPPVGRSLRPLLEGGALEERPVCAEAIFRREVRLACRRGDLKARFRFDSQRLPSEDAELLLFDLAADPREGFPLPPGSLDSAAAALRLRSDSDLWWHPARIASARQATALDAAADPDEVRARLKALGYL